MIRCCIFDLDGTLLNTLKALTLTVNLAMSQWMKTMSGSL